MSTENSASRFITSLTEEFSKKTLVDEIYDRYGDMFDIGMAGGLSFSYNGIGLTRLAIQTSQSTTSNPSSPRKPMTKVLSMGLANRGISTIGNLDELKDCCENVTELDISNNNFNDWQEIRLLLNSIKKLSILNLKSNPLAKSNEVEVALSHFNNDWVDFSNETLNTLILNSCNVDLKVIEYLLTKLVNLNELHLSANNYSTVTFSPDFKKESVKRLFFQNNSINDWKEICKLGHAFPNLEYLCISENNLSDFNQNPENLSSSKSIAEYFQNLKSLTINKLNIKEWSSIDQLRDFKKLNRVRIQEVPLISKYSKDEKFFLMVSHLGENVDTLNGSAFSKVERETCERNFIRFYMNLDEKPALYFQLQKKHGKLDPLADIDFKSGEYVQVKVSFNDKNTYLKVNTKNSVDEFKKSLEDFVGHKSTAFRIYHNYILDLRVMDPRMSLGSYRLRDEDEFVIKLQPLMLNKAFSKVDVKILFRDNTHLLSIDCRQSIGEFKKSLERIVGCHSKNFQLFHYSWKTSQMSSDLKLMNKCLGSLNISNGDEFKVELKEQQQDTQAN